MMASIALKTDGTLWTWGSAEYGMLANGTTSPDISSPVQVGALTTWTNLNKGTESAKGMSAIKN